MKKILSLIMVVITLITCFNFMLMRVSASDVTPRYNNTNSTTTNFNISSSGLATVSISCSGKTGVTQSIEVRSYIQRKVGLFWFKVDNGLTNDEWVDYKAGSSLNVKHTLQLTKKDDYRVKIEITVSGTGGADDVIEKTLTATYS